MSAGDEAIRGCLRPEPNNTFIPERRAQIPLFVPKELRYTCKERKLMDLQDSFSKTIPSHQAQMHHEEPIAVYPLSKMSSERVSDGRKKDNGAITSELTERETPFAYNDTIKAKDLKLMYDLRSSQALPFDAPPRTMCSTHKDVQQNYNKTLSTIRNAQHNYSDIFALKQPSTDGQVHHVSAIPNRDKREARLEIHPSEFNRTYRPSELGRDAGAPITARERYARELATTIAETTQRTKPVSVTHRNRESETESNLFGRPLTSQRPRPRAKVAVLRLHNIPQSMSEPQLIEGVRSCRCYITKLWLPYNVLLGNHKGVGSIIVRESWCPPGEPENCSGGDATCRTPTGSTRSSVGHGCENDDHEESTTQEPFQLLRHWLKSHGITVSVEETSTE